MSSLIVKRALRLADQPDASWIDLAKALCAAKDKGDGSLQQFFELRPKLKRAGYYLIKVWEHFSGLPVAESELAAVGWTKLDVIASDCTPGTEQQWITAALNCTVADLKQGLQTGLIPTGKTHRIRFDLSPSQYKALRAALLQHGALPSGKRLLGKEKALIKAIKGAQKS